MDLVAIILDGFDLVFAGALLLSFAATVFTGIVLIVGLVVVLLLWGLAAWALDALRAGERRRQDVWADDARTT